MLKQRVITALAIGPTSLVLLFSLGGGAFACFIGLILLGAGWEWANLSGATTTREKASFVALLFVTLVSFWLTGAAYAVWPLVLALLGWCLALYWVARYPSATDQWQASLRRYLMGICVLVPCWVGFLHLRETPWWLLYVLFVVWGADIGAYFAGRAFGNRKLAPRVSPGKSWAGVYGGLGVTGVFAIIMGLCQQLSFAGGLWLIVISLVVTLASVLGDLFESMLKRHRGIKDSGNLLPGHGGLLDRLDSLTAAVPLFALLAPWVA
ncbi:MULTISPECIES: phosphatidate cytidylyltransferase [Larsenimonas]|uniref:Phosphatidate cytidylyltransferase n=1 Tax=Larsenimonas suaedae TaxID=1851019 RepID=A0ABU1GTH8_9GAMM|nr:phosphatidate cytidylyltransferase [Larsenimonas suaedae]MCM2972317.1 phosphatidate cytidylyltransferase [Larsenimonas suaedae]MCM5704119.1 phosphatidate cytidylyltransferase [Larsenimonas salina]MDR5894887.1 phosphatidate cytidylyltransferase [Larsenimonas suaedae]